jgi:hypothetical protein
VGEDSVVGGSSRVPLNMAGVDAADLVLGASSVQDCWKPQAGADVVAYELK